MNLDRPIQPPSRASHAGMIVITALTAVYSLACWLPPLRLPAAFAEVLILPPLGGAGLARTSVFGLMLGPLRRRTRGRAAPRPAHSGADVAVFAILLAGSSA